MIELDSIPLNILKKETGPEEMTCPSVLLNTQVLRKWHIYSKSATIGSPWALPSEPVNTHSLVVNLKQSGAKLVKKVCD